MELDRSQACEYTALYRQNCDEVIPNILPFRPILPIVRRRRRVPDSRNVKWDIPRTTCTRMGSRSFPGNSVRPASCQIFEVSLAARHQHQLQRMAQRFKLWSQLHAIHRELQHVRGLSISEHHQACGGRGRGQWEAARLGVYIWRWPLHRING